MTVKNALSIIKALDLDPREYVIMESAALAAYGLLPWDETDELKILAVGEAWKKINEYGLEIVGSVSGDMGAALFGEVGRVYSRWVGSFRDCGKDTYLIGRGNVIDGLNFANPADVVRVYLELNRKKDHKLIERLESLLKESSKEDKYPSELMNELRLVFTEFGFSL